MRSFLIGLVALFLAPAAAAHEAIVTVTPQGEDVLATITLDTPVTRLALGNADVVRGDTIAVATPGLTMADNAITGETPFTQVTLRLGEDLTERDAKYLTYYRVGAGRLLYMPTVYPDPETWDLTLRVSGLPEGWTRWPETALPKGYLFLGPATMVRQFGDARFIFDGNGSPAFEAEIERSVGASLGFLTQLFGMPPAAQPFIAASVVASDQAFNRGSVTADAIVVMRFGGGTQDFASDTAGARALAATRSLILHEGAHFWNGGVARFAQGTPQWLHEGGAEYIATLGSYRLGWTNREAIQASFGQWLDRCSTSLSYSEEMALNEFDFIPANLRYSCGPLLHLIADLYLAEEGAAGTVLDGWRETVQRAAADDGEYDLADFTAALGDPALLDRPALAAILATSGPERWNVVRSELRRLGIGLEYTSDPILRARSVLMPLIRGQCTGLGPGEGYGFYFGGETFKLDTPAGCGMLAGNLELATLDSRPVSTLSAEDYAAFQALCAAGEPVPFGLTDGRILAVPCPGDLPDAATRPVITALPRISAFSN